MTYKPANKMEKTTNRVESQIQDLNRLVEKTGHLLPENLKEKHKNRLKELQAQVEKFREPVLHIGLLGGTGVGKSTIINALAGEQVSSVSDRRPHTDLVVVYRHVSTTLPEDIPIGCINEPHRVHENQSIAGLVLYDFPDFDSIVAEHAELVLSLLEHMDIAVWVASPEKYADFEFYRFLKKATKHQDNFIFVMNKIDTIKAPDSTPEEKLKTILGDFAIKLKNNGIVAPRIYAFSAKELGTEEASEWFKKDFENFKSTIFKKRDIKEIRAIKEANLETELRSFIEEIKNTYRKYVKLPVELNAILLEFQKSYYELRESIPLIARQFITDKTIGVLTEQIQESSADITPVNFFKRFWRKTPLKAKYSEEKLGWESDPSHEDSRLEPIKDTFKSTMYRITTALSRFGIDNAEKGITELEEVLDQELSKFINESRHIFSDFREKIAEPGNRLREFIIRAKQWSYLGIPVVFLVISLIGPETLKNFTASPGLGKGLFLLFNMVLSLYTPSGLVSLLSFLVIELILVAFLTAQSIKRDERKLKREIEIFNEYLASRLAKHLDSFKTRLEKMVGRIIDEVKSADTLIRKLESHCLE